MVTAPSASVLRLLATALLVPGCDNVATAIVTGTGTATGATAAGADTATTDEGTAGAGDDRDGDGVTADLDCNDFLATAFPDAPEVFDGFDNDCDGTIDEDGANSPAFFGYGAATVGGAGGTVVRVTSLSDAGAGTLRNAVETASGPTIIEFDLPGEIVLTSTLRLQSFMTINGASAPSPGVTLRLMGEQTQLLVPGTQDVIVSHLRVIGSHTVGVEPSNNDAAVFIDGDTLPDNLARRVVFDHLSVAQSTGGGIDVWGDVRDVTISHCMVYDSWSGSTLAYFNGPEPFRREGVSLYRNAWIENQAHNPQLRGDTRAVDFVNNVVVDWGGVGTETATGMWIRAEAPEASVNLNVVANHFASTRQPQWALAYGQEAGPGDPAGGPSEPTPQGTVLDNPSLGDLWVEGNRFPGETVEVYSTVDAALPTDADATLPAWPAVELGEATLPWVGTHYATADEQARVAAAAATL